MNFKMTLWKSSKIFIFLAEEKSMLENKVIYGESSRSGNLKRIVKLQLWLTTRHDFHDNFFTWHLFF